MNGANRYHHFAFATLTVVTLLTLTVRDLSAAPKVVEMLNSHDGRTMAFSKPLLHVKVAEQVHFKATDPTHSVSFIQGGVPAGVKPLKGVFNQDTHYTFEKPGIYAYKCPAHYGMGMVAIIVVGKDLHNLAQVQSLPLMPAARKRLSAILKQLEVELQTK